MFHDDSWKVNFWGSKGHDSQNIAGVGLCTLVRVASSNSFIHSFTQSLIHIRVKTADRPQLNTWDTSKYTFDEQLDVLN